MFTVGDMKILRMIIGVTRRDWWQNSAYVFLREAWHSVLPPLLERQRKKRIQKCGPLIICETWWMYDARCAPCISPFHLNLGVPCTIMGCVMRLFVYLVQRVNDLLLPGKSRNEKTIGAYFGFGYAWSKYERFWSEWGNAYFSTEWNIKE